MSTSGRATMFTAVLIHAGSARAHLMRYLATSSDCVEIQRDFEHLPHEHEITRALGTISPQLVVIDLGTDEALGLATRIRNVIPATSAIIGYGPSLENAMLAPRVGFDATISDSADSDEFRNVVQESLRKRSNTTEFGLFCFLPSKAGSGCSTTVVNTAAALARDAGKRVLVLDGDLRSSILAILLGCEPTRSIQSVLTNINLIDRNRFPDCAHRVQGVDYLFSSRSVDTAPPDWSDYFHLLAMVKPLYDVVLVDLPELVNSATYELVRRAERTFVVTTPEIPAMTLARHRIEELQRLRLQENQIALLVNRWHRSDPSPEEIGRMVHRDVSMVFPNDYPVIRTAIVGGRPVSERSRLGQAFSEFALELIGKGVPKDTSITGKLKSLWGIRETAHV